MKIILNKYQLQVTIERLAYQLIENYVELDSIVLIGIQPRGIFLGNKIFDQLQKIHPDQKIKYGKLDITFYRDDIRKELHQPNQTDISFSIEDKNVILIDDVLYTGRTIRAALDALQDFGRPKKVELCVLVNRRFDRELPIQPDYCGKTIDGQFNEKVKVDKDKGEVVIY